MKILGKILKNYISTYQNGLPRGRFNDPKDIYQPSAPEIYLFTFDSPINLVASVFLRESFCSIAFISFHMLEPKTNYQLFRLLIGPKANYQLFKLIIGFGYNEAIATITGSQDHAMLNLSIL